MSYNTFCTTHLPNGEKHKLPKWACILDVLLNDGGEYKHSYINITLKWVDFCVVFPGIYIRNDESQSIKLSALCPTSPTLNTTHYQL